jgi:FkbM family methyltransferase
MKSFKNDLEKKLLRSRYINYGVDNYDEYRFGELPNQIVSYPRTYVRLKRVLADIIGYKTAQFLIPHEEFLEKYGDGLQRIYEQINNDGKKLLVNIIAYRLLGFKKVKLPRNNKEYWDAIRIANSLTDNKDTFNPHFLHFILQKYDLKKVGYEIQLYFSSLGIAIDFIFEQYAYKSGNKIIVNAEKGDTVLDLGACWGDTALYFAHKTGEQGKVYSFEFIPENIKLFNLNISLNPNLIKQIELVPNPVSNKSGDLIYYTDNGPGSRIKFEPFDGQTGFASTISIDDFVRNNSIDKVDFIKMDIEGAEPDALEGAIETIKRFKPKLAIAIYHSMDDFVSIPDLILKLNLGYKLYLGHYTIHSEETVIFAKIEE